MSKKSLSVWEYGGGTYTVVLDTQPSADVTITPHTSDRWTAFTSGPLTFSRSNWDQAQEIRVNGMSDSDHTDDIATISHTVSSSDPQYDGLAIASVKVTVLDDDGYRVFLAPWSLTIREGSKETYALRLAAPPASEVTITPFSNDSGAVTFRPAKLTFTPSNFGVRTVTVTAVSDDDANDETVTISHTASSADSRYDSGLDIASVTVSVIDDDSGDDPGGDPGDGTGDDPGGDPGDGTGDDGGGDPGDGTGDDGGGDPGGGPVDVGGGTGGGPSDGGGAGDEGQGDVGGTGGGTPAPANQPPEAANDTARTSEDEEVVIDILANDTDVDGDALRVASVTTPSNGTVRIVDSGGAVAYAPAADWHGIDRFAYEVSDGNDGTATAEVEVTVEAVNDTPEASDDTARTVEDEEVVVDILANDSDVDGDALRVTSVTVPSTGKARIVDSGGAVAYAPEANWHGIDRFAYEVSDGNGGTATAEVEVTVEAVNDPPEAADDTAQTVEDEEVVVDVLANDTDVDGDGLGVTSVTAPSTGTARIVDSGGAVAYAPAADWHGIDRFAYEVSDSNGGTATAEVEVTVGAVNDAPEAADDTARTVEDEEVVIDVLANDSDVDGDGLRVASVTAPSNGTARIVDSGGAVAYAPEADWHGADRFAYEVSDGSGGTATAEVELTVEGMNDAPEVAGTIPDQALEEGGAATEIDLAPYYRDRDRDALSYSAVSSDPGVAAATVAGSMLTLSPAGYGAASVEVTARDPAGLSASQTFAVGASDRMVRLAFDETFAAMGRSHLASARMTLGRLAGSSRAPAVSMLEVMGRQVPLSRSEARTAAARLLESWVLSQARHSGMRTEVGAYDRQMAEWAAVTSAVRSVDVDAAGTLGPTAFASALDPGGRAGATEWMFAFGGDQESGPASGGGVWRFWGQGDLQLFRGEPSAQRGYEGDLRTGWAGLDRALGQRWLMGVAVARSLGAGDWRAGSADGRIETSLWTAHPYLRWSDGSASVWAMAGGGRGTATDERTSGRTGSSDLDLWLGLVEARRRLSGWFGFRADVAWVSLATSAGEETVDGRSAVVDQQRLGLELRPHKMRLGGVAVEPFGEASARRDGGAGQTGSGVEFAAGLRLAYKHVRIDAQGRILALHSADAYLERGFGLTFAFGSTASAEGLSLSVSPRWGAPVAATGALWREELAEQRALGPGLREAWSFESAARYAHRLPGGGLLVWSGGLSRTERGYAAIVGAGIVPGVGIVPSAKIVPGDDRSVGRRR